MLLFSNGLIAQRIPADELYKKLYSQTDTIRIVEIFGELADCYKYCRIDSSLKYAARQLILASEINNERAEANAYEILSSCYAVKTDYNISLISAYHALKIYKKLDDSIHIVSSLCRISDCYFNLGRDRNANIYFNDAINIVTKIEKNDSLYAELYTRYIINNYTDNSRKDSVKKLIDHVLPIAEKYAGSPMALYLKACLLSGWQQGRLAEDSLKRLAAVAIKNNWPLVAIELYDKMNALGSDAVYYHELVFNLAEETGCLEFNLPVIAKLFDHYNAQHNTSKVAYFSDEIMKISSNARYDAEKGGINLLEYFNKEKSLHQLSVSNQLMQSELKDIRMTAQERKWILRISIIILGLLIILLLIKIRAYQLLKQQQHIQKATNASVSVTHIELKATDEFKNKLIAIIANDFSAPLKQISAITTELRLHESDPIATTTLIKQIAVIARGSLCIFDNILKWVKLQLTGLEYKVQACRPYEIMQSVLKHIMPVIESGNIIFVNQIPQQLVIYADVEMLKMVHQHLMQLCLHFTDSGRLLIISAWEEENVAHIRFITEPKEPVDVVLKGLKDWQQNMYALSYGITQDFVQKMNGELRVTSADERYLVFHVILPDLPQ